MFRKSAITAFSVLLVAGCSGEDDTAAMATANAESAPQPQDAATVISQVETALGMENLSSITYEGRAWTIRNGFRQTRTANPPWRTFTNEIMNYQRTIDLSQPASVATGEIFAQNLFFDPPTEGNYLQNITAGNTGWGQQLEVWLTPWGFIEGASNNNAELSMETMNGEEYTVLSWMSPEGQTSPSGERYTVNGYINDNNLVEYVETWVEDAFMGDLRVSAHYDDYENIDGLMVPTRMEQHRGGGAVFGVHVMDAQANPQNLNALLSVPEGGGRGGFGGGGGQAAAPDPADLIAEVAPGVWEVTGGYGALVVEFVDYITVFESGQSEARAQQIMDAVATVTDKPIRYLVNSHPHSDHTGGLVPFVREGVTLIVSENSVDFLRMALSSPRTLLGEDTLDPQFEVVEDVMVLEDEMNRLELHHVPNLHTDSMLFAYLPEHRIAMQADFTVRDGDQQTVHAQALAEYVQENDLQFDSLLAVHAPPQPQTREDLMRALPDDQE